MHLKFGTIRELQTDLATSRVKLRTDALGAPDRTVVRFRNARDEIALAAMTFEVKSAGSRSSKRVAGHMTASAIQDRMGFLP